MEEQRKKSGVELLPSLHTRMKVRAASANIPLWKVWQDAVENYLRPHPPTAGRESSGSEHPIAGKPSLGADFPKAHRNLLEMLQVIVDSGNRDAINAVTRNLEVFAEFARMKAHGSQAKGQADPPSKPASRARGSSGANG